MRYEIGYSTLTEMHPVNKIKLPTLTIPVSNTLKMAK
jgi:hypothetical protein